MGGGLADPPTSSGHLPLEGAVDNLGRLLSSRSTSGGWTSAFFIIWMEMAGRIAYYGIFSNLIIYLTGPLGESTASAAANVSAWSGAASMLPLLGGLLADSYVGRYRTIVLSSLLCVLGLGMLTLSAAAPPLRPPKCNSANDGKACLPTRFQVAFFFFSLYLVAIAQGGHKPCVQAFGADQFDENDSEECKSKSSFFNWWYFAIGVFPGVAVQLLNYVQDSISWGLGFGLPCVSMVIALAVFLMGTRTYRYYTITNDSPFTELAQSCAVLWRSWKSSLSGSSKGHPDIEEAEAKETLLPKSKSSEGYQCSNQSQRGSGEHMKSARGILRLFPIWATCLMYAVVFAQPLTLFTKQGSTMDRRIAQTLLVPPTALQALLWISIVIFIPIYDRFLVPLARMFTGIPSGVTTLQRIGIGLLLSVVSMAVAALVEMRRLQMARDLGLVDLPKATVPMSLWWLVPQYVIFGVSDAFTMVGLQEFFYDQVPDGMRSLGLALCLSIFGFGSFVSSFLVSVVDKISRRSGEGWFSNNLNRAHLDYFYWLLAGLNAVDLAVYLYFARVFRYKKKRNVSV